MVIGANMEDGASNGISNQGAVYVYRYDGTNWTETQILRASDAASGDYFGIQVSLSPNADRLAVTTSNAEALYTYDISAEDASTWASTEQIFASPSSRTDEFGLTALAFNGIDIVVGLMGMITIIKPWSPTPMATVFLMIKTTVAVVRHSISLIPRRAVQARPMWQHMRPMR